MVGRAMGGGGSGELRVLGDEWETCRPFRAC